MMAEEKKSPRRPKTTRQRAPIINQSNTAVQDLVNKAQKMGDALKHNIIVWRLDMTTAELKCSKCNGKMAVALWPPPGCDNIGGPASKARCNL